MALQPNTPTTPRCWDRPRTCVEVEQTGRLVMVRDTKQHGMHKQPALVFTADEWVKFVEEVRESDKFDFNFEAAGLPQPAAAGS